MAIFLNYLKFISFLSDVTNKISSFLELSQFSAAEKKNTVLSYPIFMLTWKSTGLFEMKSIFIQRTGIELQIKR